MPKTTTLANKHSCVEISPNGEILMAMFTEEDVLAGEDVAGKMKLRGIVNALWQRRCDSP